jgi:hypothetical protein
MKDTGFSPYLSKNRKRRFSPWGAFTPKISAPDLYTTFIATGSQCTTESFS